MQGGGMGWQALSEHFTRFWPSWGRRDLWQLQVWQPPLGPYAEAEWEMWMSDS
jgi:hypothetical protein